MKGQLVYYLKFCKLGSERLVSFYFSKFSNLEIFKDRISQEPVKEGKFFTDKDLLIVDCVRGYEDFSVLTYDDFCEIFFNWGQGAIKIFTNVIRKILKDCEDEGKKVTQVELANVLGISRQAFTNKLTRDSFFIDDVVKIANYLGMQVVLKGKSEYVIEKED